MQSIILVIMIVVSLISAIVTGRINELSAAILEGGKQAVEMGIFMLSSLCIWSGILNILKQSGGVNLFGKILNPVIRMIFPGNSRNTEFCDNAVMNITSNMLGISNAATPAGLTATKIMAEGSNNKITRELAAFVIINTASIQIIPTSACMLRQKYGSLNAYNILPAVWLTSIISLIVGLMAVYLLYPNKKFIKIKQNKTDLFN